MKRNIIKFVPLSILCVLAATGCNRSSGAQEETLTENEKILLVSTAASKKLDSFYKTLSTCNIEYTPENNNLLTDNKTTVYSKLSAKNYCAQQLFQFYIFNSVNYGIQHMYNGKNPIASLGETVWGKTRRMPYYALQDAWDLYVGPNEDSKLYLNVSLRDKKAKDTYILDFKVDWSFENDVFASLAPLKKYNSKILTTGSIVYDNKKRKNISNIYINYYWTGLNRDFGSTNFDYENDEFTLLNGSVGNDTNIWDEGSTYKDAYIYEDFNNGTLTADSYINKYPYKYTQVYKGKITSNIHDLGIQGYDRNTDIGETNDSSAYETEWKKLFNDIYDKTKVNKFRGEKDALDVSSIKLIDGNIDNCLRYGIAKTKLIWIFTKDDQGNVTFQEQSLVPFIERKQLVEYLKDLEKLVSDPNKTKFIKNANKVISKLDDADYFGEIEETDNLGFIFKYSYSGMSNDTYNCYSAFKFCYTLASLTGDISIDFTIQDGVVTTKAEGFEPLERYFDFNGKTTVYYYDGEGHSANLENLKLTKGSPDGEEVTTIKDCEVYYLSGKVNSDDAKDIPEQYVDIHLGIAFKKNSDCQGPSYPADCQWFHTSFNKNNPTFTFKFSNNYFIGSSKCGQGEECSICIHDFMLHNVIYY